MKAFYIPVPFFSWLSRGIFPVLGSFLVILFASFEGLAQCPTGYTLNAPAVCAGQPIRLNITVTPAPPASFAGPYTAVINGNTYTGIQHGIDFNITSTEDNFFGVTVPPVKTEPEPAAYELGVKFSSNINGIIKGIRFYKSALSTGTFTGTLWTATGTPLATGVFTTTASGWQELTFASPVSITAGTTYVASYYNPSGTYAFVEDFFGANSIVSTSGNLTAPQSVPPTFYNGVYRIGAGFPATSFQLGANYYVDVIFQPTNTSTVYNLTSITDGGLCSEVGAPNISSVTATVNPLPSGDITGTNIGAIGQQASLNFSNPAGTAPFSLVVNGNTISGVTPPTPFNAGIIQPTISTRIWTSATLPIPTLANDEDRAVEVGIKFQASVAGSITGLRFYKGVPSLTPTVLNLYRVSDQALLGTVTYSDAGNVTGFVEAALPAPVAILANTTYLVSYYNSDGDYVKTDGFLATAFTNGPITVVSNSGVAGPNGVYDYAAGFPTSTCGTFCNGPNYWADVVFSYATTTTYPFTLTQITDANGCISNVNQELILLVPVTLAEFTAGLEQNNNVRLNWVTASESNNKGFDVERSIDATKWLSVGYVSGSGTSSSTKKYSMVDRNLPNGKYFYRLKQVDFDGNFKYSNILSIDINGKLTYELNQSYPNPSRGSSTITYSIPVKTQVVLAVYDMQGRVVSVLQNGERAAGKYAVTVPANLLRAGVYYYKLEAGDFKSTRKMIIQ